jgi:hypothetical protein
VGEFNLLAIKQSLISKHYQVELGNEKNGLFPLLVGGDKGVVFKNFPLKTNKYKIKKKHFLPPPPNPLLKGGGILALT